MRLSAGGASGSGAGDAGERRWHCRCAVRVPCVCSACAVFGCVCARGAAGAAALCWPPRSLVRMLFVCACVRVCVVCVCVCVCERVSEKVSEEWVSDRVSE